MQQGTPEGDGGGEYQDTSLWFGRVVSRRSFKRKVDTCRYDVINIKRLNLLH